MSGMSNLHARVEAFEALLRADASHLVDEFHDIVGKLLPAAETDAETVASDAEAATKPVLETAEQDAEELAKTAAADVDPQADPAAATTPPASTSQA